MAGGGLLVSKKATRLERQAELADTLEVVGNERAVNARVRADTSQARPAREATQGAAEKAPRARRAVGRTATRGPPAAGAPRA